jgi:hypothetical protein
VLAVDREPMVNYLKQGMYEPAYTLMPPLPGYQLPIPDWARLTDRSVARWLDSCIARRAIRMRIRCG